MRNLKKFLALVMALVMAFSLMLSASAANPVKTFDDAGNITEQFMEAADVLTGMKVFQGDEGGFRPGDQITRAEVAALIYRLATGDTGNDRKDLYKDYGNFTDVSSTDWFAGYVGYCANAGYIKGKTDTTFDPYAPVTGYEALAMILRAVGYDKNGEFTGPTWQTNVSALSTQLGILKQVKSTHYGDRLYEASRRDVVASLLFESAQIPMVEYTQIGGYNKFQNLVNNTLNDSLGWKNFGLTSTTRIVVGNQETGEDYTKVGIEYLYGSNGLSAVTERGSYEYVTGADRTNNSTNITLSFNTDTGIDMFGHKFKVWYDGKSDQGVQDCWYDTNGDGTKDANEPTWKMDDEFKTVYATFDKATLAKHVYATDSNITSTANTNGAVGLRSAAKDAGFANTNTTRWSASYSRIDPTAVPNFTASHQTVPTGLTAATLSDSPVDTYYLVSNNDDKTVDVAVREDNELARIDKKDTTANTKTLTLGNTTAQTSTYGRANDGVIRESALTPGSIKDLGSIVFATMIVGTDRIMDSVAWNTWMNGYYKLENAITEENQIVASA